MREQTGYRVSLEIPRAPNNCKNTRDLHSVFASIKDVFSPLPFASRLIALERGGALTKVLEHDVVFDDAIGKRGPCVHVYSGRSSLYIITRKKLNLGFAGVDRLDAIVESAIAKFTARKAERLPVHEITRWVSTLKKRILDVDDAGIDSQRGETREMRKKKDGKIDTNWECDDAARFRGRGSSSERRKNNNDPNYRLVLPICPRGPFIIKAPRRSARRIPTKTMAPRDVRNNTNNRDRWKYCLVRNFLRSATTLEGGARSHLPARLLSSLLFVSHIYPLRGLPSSISFFNRQGAISYRTDPNILKVILAHCFYKETLLSSSPDSRREKGARCDGISRTGNSSRPRKESSKPSKLVHYTGRNVSLTRYRRQSCVCVCNL